MTAARHVNPNQLAMFMPAKKLIQQNPHPGDLDQQRDYMEYDEDDVPEGGYPEKEVRAQLWESKLDESGEIEGNEPESLWDSIERTRQVKTPVYLSHEFGDPVITSGHHRIAAAVDIDPDMEIPVEHYNSVSIATARGRHDGERWSSYGDTERPQGARAEGREPQMYTRMGQYGVEYDMATHTPTPYRTPSYDESSDDYYARALARGRL